MKLHLTIVFVLALASPCFGQTPSASPVPTQSASPEKPRARTFGSSLGKYRDKEQQNFQNKQKTDESDDVETIRITTDLVVNDVLVTDQNGKMINELNKDDFVVTEDGAPQKIEVFSPGENGTVPRSIVLIIDCGTPQAPYLKNSIQAAKILVDKLAQQDKMAIVTVDVRLRTDFTQDKTLLKKTLDSLEKKDIKLAGGAEFNALLAVLNEMFAAEDRQRIIVFQGDGSEIIWLKADKDGPYPVPDFTREFVLRWIPRRKAMQNFGFSDVKEAIERSRATIYSVTPGIRFLGFSKEEQKARAKISFTNTYRSMGFREASLSIMLEEFQSPFEEMLLAGQTAMLRVAELSGGNLGFIEKPEDAEDIYSNIFKLIRNRYVIGYYPTNQGRDGKRREMKVEVRNHPEYIVTGRKAYLPQ
jgi:VWFA-related protein